MTTLNPLNPPTGATMPAAALCTVRLLAIAAAAGVLLGAGDLALTTHVHQAWAGLANSSAVWAVSAFVLGALLRTDPPRAAVAGVVMLLVAVESYYVYAGLHGMADRTVLWSQNTRMWLTFGVIAGVVFGVAGAWTAGSVWWQRVLGSATGAGVLLGEAVHLAGRVHLAEGTWQLQLQQSVALLGVLGLAALVLTARQAKVLVPAAILVLPMALFTAAGFTAVGIGF